MNRELLFSVTRKDFQIEFFSGTGAGGQHRNKHQNCVRLYHPASGARATGQSHRNRQANLKQAFEGLQNNPVFKVWLNRKVFEALSGKSMEQKVQEAMRPENLKIERRGESGRWEKWRAA